ncbi:MAG: FAD binding domain-containing protein [Methyloligellaceae bacterium]
MIPASFDYVRPSTIKEAFHAKVSGGAEAVILAGGQSLITDLKLRNKQPVTIIDISAIPGLDEISFVDNRLFAGAMARQTEIVSKARDWTLLGQVADAAADPMVRRRGTLVGAFCEADPGGDWVAAGLVLEATVSIASMRPHSGNELVIRKIPLSDFIVGAKQVALSHGDIVTGAIIPAQPAGVKTIYKKVKHTSVGWSIASTAMTYDPTNHQFRIAVSGAVDFPKRLTVLEQKLGTTDIQSTDAINLAVSNSLQELKFRGDHYASAEYRKHRLGVLLKRTIQELVTGR